ncbi:phage major tail tube protein [Clostridium butyricum]|uniref:phage major tail tube protein n=1 Tax=Clostridium butyricum TaxID=1492 RepID=UPI00129AE5F3|nr:phage major tail tube protein [Clostridium butyricum]MDU5103486.1 phage major tail tube protein [Clostridium butyricum]QGH21800.1 phage tail protein [Clostridium butyricum]QGH25839.1 phage tail protein [Clostridium butyricum]
MSTAAKEIKNKTIDFSVYVRDSGSAEKIGNSTDVTLPSVEKITDTIKGSGIMGELDLPSYGQISSMETEISMRVSDDKFATLSASSQLEYRWVTDAYDTSTGKARIIANKAFLTVANKKADEGKIESGASQDGSLSFEVIAYKRICDGKEILNIDKLNGIYSINGKNMYSDISQYL